MQSKKSVVIVGAQQVVGKALCAQWEARGVEVRAVEDVARVWAGCGDDVGVMWVDTSVWWGGGAVLPEDYAVYHEWMEVARRRGVRHVGLITSAATLGVDGKETGLYRPGEGTRWEDDVWRFEAEGYAYMGQGLGVWFVLPTMVVGEGEMGRTGEWWGGDGAGGDVVHGEDVARGCLAAMERGRMGRRYVMTGEWVEGMGEGEERVYLGGRRYDVEWAKEELGYGGRQDAGVLRGMLSRK